MKIQYAMYKGEGMIGNALVRWWKRTEFSHCELVIDGVCYSSSVMDKGVRCKVIDLDPCKWELINLPDHLAPAALEYFRKTKGQRYSWASIIAAQFFASDYDEPQAAFCSEWCGAALGVPNPVIYAPEPLGDLLRWLYKDYQ